MDGEQASRFVSSLVKSIQALCNGYIEFSSSIEVIGHIHLNIDRSVKLDYVLTEEVSKSISEGATVFASHSYHSQPPSSVSSKNANDTSGRSRQKQSASVTHNEDSDMVSQKHSASHFSENSEPSHTGSFVDTSDRLSGKPENRQKFSLAQESYDRRRRSAPVQSHLQRTSSPAAKRSRQSDCNSELNNTQNFEVIEIKEEPDDEPAVFFGDSSSHAAAGQDLQTPDFSNVVMESLDRVGKVEGTDLVGSGEGGQMQQQPFPIMMHTNSGMPSSSVSSSVPGPSLADPQTPSLASTSGSRGTRTIPKVKSEVVDSEDSFAPEWSPSSSGPVGEYLEHYMERIPPKVLSEAELRLLRRRQKNAMHARLYRQRAKQSEEKHQMLKEKAKERQKRYVARMKEKRAYLQSHYHVGRGRAKAAYLHSSSRSSMLPSDPYPGHGVSAPRPAELEQSPGRGSVDQPYVGRDLSGAGVGFHVPFFLQSRLKKQYSPQQMLAAMADVDAGKPVSRAARAHGVPLRSLYRKLKNRNSSSGSSEAGLPFRAGRDLRVDDDSLELLQTSQ